MDDDPLSTLSRPANPDREIVEVRVKLQPEFVAVLDACAGNLALDRTALIRRWLKERLLEEQRGAIRIANASRGNTALADLPDTELQ
ncbi:hypothetical protein ABXN37_19735 [Piscinibacter sakaiensis]|uniref:Ribbon-helix-helix protein CopG domain-containing protein n=1 Tax=Piscinibacter sakaiensis TaxID=1547922 RepID=A0A0K8P3Y4_PISS1|nr:hypothetical protein [Piscinibacter sakaiensis]GAP37358.1 hypothetical protein ISF6_3213 [Piscinibacter sakaiensis]